METKICSCCGIEKDIDLFYVDKSCFDKLNRNCKKCIKIKSKKWRKTYRLSKEYKKSRANQRKRHAKKYPQKIKDKAERANKKQVEGLGDGYIRHLINQTGVSYDDITPEMIELKRAQIKLKRAIRDKDNE